eukprot:g11495.t1 g11495   contig5:1006050-1006867(+)
MNNTNICHILPCSIDQDMTAPVGMYFHPTQLNLSGCGDNARSATGSSEGSEAADDVKEMTKNDDGSGGAEEGTHDAVLIMAAQYRGRGLLCATDAPEPTISNSNDTRTTKVLSKLPSTMLGVALAPTNSHTNNNNNNLKEQPLATIEHFSQIYNWQHEHDVEKVKRMTEEKNWERAVWKGFLDGVSLAIRCTILSQSLLEFVSSFIISYTNHCESLGDECAMKDALLDALKVHDKIFHSL